MKRIIGSIILFLLFIPGLKAQQNLPEMGMALRLSGAGDRLFVNHPRHPFGTRLKVINLMNNAELELNVEGTPSSGTWAWIELSSMASDFLGIPGGVLNQVRIEVMAVPTAAPAMRPRIGNITQTGNAVVRGNRTDLSASHPSIAIGRRLQLTNNSNGRTVVVTVTARCQASADRIIEISPPAASALGMGASGSIRLVSQD